MFTGVSVMEQDEFEEWLADTTAAAPVIAEDASMADRGFQVLSGNGCNACHSSDGSRLVGPSYLGSWGTERTVITNGEEREIVADSAYIRRSIYDPNYDVVDGFNRGLMLSYKGQISEEEIDMIIAYLKELNEE